MNAKEKTKARRVPWTYGEGGEDFWGESQEGLIGKVTFQWRPAGTERKSRSCLGTGFHEEGTEAEGGSCPEELQCWVSVQRRAEWQETRSDEVVESWSETGSARALEQVAGTLLWLPVVNSVKRARVEQGDRWWSYCSDPGGNGGAVAPPVTSKLGGKWLDSKCILTE